MSTDVTPQAGSRRPIVQALGIVVVVSALLLGLAFALGFPDLGEDTLDYRNLALGNWGQVNQPFSSRFLHPVFVHGLAKLLAVSVDSAFRAVALLAVPVMVLGLTVLLRRLRVPILLLAPGVVTAPVVGAIRLAYMPDLFYTLLLIGFFLLLCFNRTALAAATLVLLYCARESTLVLGVTVVFVVTVSRGTHRRREAGLFLAATVVGMLVNRHVSNHLSTGNVHHLGGLSYLLGKVPYNFTKNILGVQVWTNTLVRTQGNQPLVRWMLPMWLRVGEITDVGVSEISPLFPLRWLVSTVTAFGVLLTVLVHATGAAWRTAVAGTGGRFARCGQTLSALSARQPVAVRVAGLYGVISLVLVPVLGTATNRYVFYAWPAFWVLGLGLFVGRYCPAATAGVRRAWPALAALLVLHVILCWHPSGPILGLHRVTSALIVFAGSVLLHVLAWHCLGMLRAAREGETGDVPPRGAHRAHLATS
jgi:hypothetical protein